MSGSKYIILCALVCSCLAQNDPSAAKILNYQMEREGTGQYFFRFESSDGILREEEGNLLDENSEGSPVIVKGSYSYADPTGKVYTVRYIADQYGFHPEGEHIQVPGYVINPDPVTPVVIGSTSRPITPGHLLQNTPRPSLQLIQDTPRPSVQLIQGTPRPSIQLIQDTPRPQFIQTTPRPQFLASEPARFQINGFSTTPRPEVTRIQVPLESKRESTKVPFGEIDTKLQSSIVNLLSSGDARGFRAANSS